MTTPVMTHAADTSQRLEATKIHNLDKTLYKTIMECKYTTRN